MGLERKRPSRRVLLLLVVPIVAVTVVGTVATALTPTLATHHPLLLIALEARNRNLVLARHVDLVPFVLVGTVRRLSSDPLYYLLGRLYGDGAVRWLERRSGGGPFVRLTERLFARLGYPMVFLFPGAVVCSLAGATGMAPLPFLAANVAGTVGAVVALRLFGDVLASPVDAVLRFFDRHLVATTAATVGLVVVWVVLARRQGHGEVQSIAEIERELEGEDGGEESR